MLLGTPLMLFPSCFSPPGAIPQPSAFPNLICFSQPRCGAEKGELRAILHGKRSVRPRSRAGQRLTALAFE
jgi:hypothetical protein